MRINSAKRQQRDAEESVRGAGDERDQRRLVDVAERRMLAANHKIELVAEDVVAVVDDQMQHEARRAEGDRGCCKPLQRVAVRACHRASPIEPVAAP
jgi:hypothetical protein